MIKDLVKNKPQTLVFNVGVFQNNIRSSGVWLFVPLFIQSWLILCLSLSKYYKIYDVWERECHKTSSRWWKERQKERCRRKRAKETMESLISNAWIHTSADKDIRLNLAVVQFGKQCRVRQRKQHTRRLYYYMTSYFTQNLFDLY